MTKGYVTTLRSFLILWLSTLPLAMIGKYGWGASPVLLFIAYLFLSVEKMAVEIERAGVLSTGALRFTPPTGAQHAFFSSHSPWRLGPRDRS